MSDVRLPDGWNELTVNQVTTRHFSGPSPICEERIMTSHDEWGILKTTAITWAGWDAAAHKVPPPTYWGNDSIMVRRGDVLVTKAGPRHRVGVVVHVTDAPDHLMVSGKMVGLSPNTGLMLPQVLAGALSMHSSQKYLDERTTGMAESQVNFTNNVLLATPIAVPPMREQQRIAEILDTADRVIRSTERLIAKLEQAKQGLLHDLLVRQSWPTSPVHEIAFKVTDGDHHTPRKSAGDGIPLIGAGNVQDGYLDLSNEEFVDEAEYARMITRCHPEAGDILISCSGSIGRVAQVPAGLRLALVRSVALVKPDTGKCLSGFLELALQSPFVQRQIKNAQKQLAQANLFQGAISELLVPLPEVNKQRAIVDHVTSYRAAITTAAQELRKLRLLKRGLMDDLLTGQVRPETAA